MGETDEELWAKVSAVVEPYGCKVTGLGPNAVAVMGDARKHFPCVFIKFPDGMNMEEIGRISTEITNKVDVGRVQMDLVVRPQAAPVDLLAEERILDDLYEDPDD